MSRLVPFCGSRSSKSGSRSWPVSVRCCLVRNGYDGALGHVCRMTLDRRIEDIGHSGNLVIKTFGLAAIAGEVSRVVTDIPRVGGAVAERVGTPLRIHRARMSLMTLDTGVEAAGVGQTAQIGLARTLVGPLGLRAEERRPAGECSVVTRNNLVSPAEVENVCLCVPRRIHYS